MTTTTHQQGESVDLDRLEALAKAATPQNLDSAEDATRPTGYVECPECGGEGTVELTADYCNYDGKAMGVQFYGIGPEHRAAEAFFRAANPATILKLIAQARTSQPSAIITDDECDQIIAKCWSKGITLQEHMRRVVRASQPAASDAQPGADERAYHAMRKAHAYCPTDLSHLDKMRWMATYFVSYYTALATPAVQAGDITDMQIIRIAGDVKQRNAGVWPGDVAFARAVLSASVQAGATVAAEPVGICCYGGLKPKSACVSCAAWQSAATASPTAAQVGAETDANDICQVPPADWYCTRKAGHDGPCAAHRHEPDRELDADDHASIARGMARLKAAPSSPAIGTASIDTLEFQALAGTWCGASQSCDQWTRTEGAKRAWSDLIAHIDARLSAAPATQAADTDARDGARYRAWRNAIITEDQDWDNAVCAAIPEDSARRAPTTSEWDAVIDAAIAAMSASASEADGSGKGDAA